MELWEQEEERRLLAVTLVRSLVQKGLIQPMPTTLEETLGLAVMMVAYLKEGTAPKGQG